MKCFLVFINNWCFVPKKEKNMLFYANIKFFHFFRQTLTSNINYISGRTALHSNSTKLTTIYNQILNFIKNNRIYLWKKSIKFPLNWYVEYNMIMDNIVLFFIDFMICDSLWNEYLRQTLVSIINYFWTFNLFIF